MTSTVDGPVTPRGRRTRATLVTAAAEVFAEKQYLATNISDISTRANVSHGTFYRYFDSKEQIFREVALDLQQRMMVSGHDRARLVPAHFSTRSEELLWRIMRANRAFLELYRENARLLAVIEQAATFNDQFRQIRREARVGFVERARHGIERMQQLGLANDDVDAHYVASALGSMVDRYAYVAFVLHEPFDFDESVRTLGMLWARAIGLDIPPGTDVPPGT